MKKKKNIERQEKTEKQEILENQENAGKPVLWSVDLAVGYGETPLISGIRVEVKAGEILTLIGPNGAGKSTILKSLAKQLKLLGGKVYVEGEELDRLKESALARKMAYVSTDKIRQEMITCEEVVSLGRYPYTGRFGRLTAEDKEKVKQALLLVDAWEIRYNDFMKISDGQKQKIRLAMAICQEPDIILLDEPTSYLDIRHKIEVLQILKRMAGKNTAVILSLHELELVRLVSDQVLCVKDHAIMRYADCEEVFRGNFINELYEVGNGNFETSLGTVFFEKNEAKPEVFVLAGNGTGIALYHRLMRQGISFATGVLQENDLDAHYAAAMTDYVITCPAFGRVTEKEIQTALRYLSSCRKLYVTNEAFGECNAENRKLIEEAQKRKIEISYIPPGLP